MTAANAETCQEGGEGGPVRGLRPSLFYVIVAIVFAADQISKSWIRRTLGYEESRPLFGNAFRLTLTHNRGGAWGVLPQGNTLFIVFAGLAVVALLIAYHRMARVELPVGTAFALALGGAIGNLLDRLRFGYVVDFFDAKIINFPVFNVADSAITLGIFLLAWHFVVSARQEAAADAASAAPPSGNSDTVSRT